MKLEVDSEARLLEWIENPVQAVFQGQDLSRHAGVIAAKPLAGCSFIACTMQPALVEAALAAGCMILPALAGLPFDPLRPSLYSPAELYDRFDAGDPVASYRECRDFRIYESVYDPGTRRRLTVGSDVLLMRRLHDASVAGALDALLDLPTRLRSVAIMGGHDVSRDAPVYAEIASMAQALAREGYLVLTGGGPGLMEAANLGAYTSGFENSAVTLNRAIERLRAAPGYRDPGWLAVAFTAWKEMGEPANPASARNIGIPTWFYGHEPPNLFATGIAKYFENSLREEGLLAVALAGVVFAEGNAGTVQEIFQDACQNYYRSYEGRKSPMVLFGKDYWAPDNAADDASGDWRKPVYPLLLKLAREKEFEDSLLVTDDPSAIVSFLEDHPPTVSE